MRKRQWMVTVVAGSLALSPLAACEQLPGEPETQGAVIGGLAGAGAGAAVAEENRLLGALIGGALGAGGGYLIGTRVDKTDADEEDREEAREAALKAQQNPATVADVRDAETADLNNDGFVTTDEVIAMSEAGLTDEQIISRLEATDQVFELAPQQEEYLVSNGVSREVVNAMDQVNQEERQRLERQDVIGSDANEEPL